MKLMNIRWPTLLLTVIIAVFGFLQVTDHADIDHTHTRFATTTANVVRVIDGDTIKATITGEGFQNVPTGSTQSVRLIGIDAPEINWDQETASCYGYESRHKLQVLAADTEVVLQTDPTQPLFDSYNRLLAYAIINNQTAGEHLLSGGYVREAGFGSSYQKRKAYTTAEQKARDKNVGLWRVCQ